LRPAARAGRGLEVLIDLDEPATQGAERIVVATRAPVMIDVAIEGTALQADAPRLHDLLSGSPVVAPLLLRPEGGTIVVRGVTSQGQYMDRLDVPAPLPDEGARAIATLWAREAIEDLELDLASGDDRKRIDERIKQIGVTHAVLSRLTSWVAIAEEPAVDPRDPVRTERIPQALPYGMEANGLGLFGGIAGGIPRALRMSARATSNIHDTGEMDVSALREALSARPPSAPLQSVARKARFDVLAQLRAVMKRLVSLSSRRDDTHRLFGSHVKEVVSLRDEIHARLSKLKAERSGIDRQWDRQGDRLERLLEDVDTSLATLQTESEQLGHAWASHFEAFNRLRDRIEAADAHLAQMEHEPPTAERRVFLRGRVLPTPGRLTVTVEISATIGFNWRPAGAVMLGGQHVTVIEQGTTRPGPIMVGSLVRLELSATPAQIARANYLEISSHDAVLVVALEGAD
jgi:hypothetical protein